MFRNRRLVITLFALVVTSCVCSRGQAQVVSWDDGGGGNNWLNIFNWDPDVALSSTNNVFIGDLASAHGDQTELGTDVTIQSLVLTNDTSVNTNGHQLELIGALGIDLGLGTSLTVVPSTSGQLETTKLKTRNTGSFQLEGGSVEISDEATTDVGGEIRGSGVVEFTQGGFVTFFNNNGMLRTGRVPGAAAEDQFVLTLIGNNGGLAEADLDGSNGTGELLLVNNTTLSLINVNTSDFGGTLEMREGSIFNSTEMFRTKSGAQITVNGTQGVAGDDTATIDGTNFVANAANIDVNSGKLVVAAGAFTMDSAAEMNVADGSEVQFNNDATIDGRLSMTEASQLTVNGNLNVNDPTFNWDGNTSRASTTVNSGGELTINTSSVDNDEVFGENGSQINLNDGKLTANVDNVWTMAGELNMNSPTGSAEFDGTAVNVTGSITANGGGVSRIRAPITFEAGSATHVEAGSDLSIIADVEFIGGFYTGDGNIRTARDITVSAGTLVDMPNGTFEVDNRNGDQTLEMFYDLELNVNSLGGEVGDLGGGNFAIDMNGGIPTLIVNLTDPDAEWTLGESGTVNLDANLTQEGAIAGSDMNVKGQILANGDARITARLDIETTGFVDTNGAELRLEGGSASDPNQIFGGIIASPTGTLVSASGLRGFGSVSPTIEFRVDADLIADGGTLSVHGEIQDANFVGAVTGGTLNLTAPLDTASIEALEMTGGTLVGQPIQNTGITRGNGNVNSIGFVNDGELVATGGGQLTIDTFNAPDLDGATNGGVIRALSADLVIVDPITESFDGVAIVDAGFVLDVQGNWILSPSSRLQLDGMAIAPATLRGPFASVQGEVAVTGLAVMETFPLFFSTVEISLPNSNDELRFAHGATFQSSGVSATGNGRIVNLVDSDLKVAQGVELDVSVLNSGNLEVFGTSTGVMTFEQFLQTATGSTALRLSGTAPGEFDQLVATQNISLDGSVELELLYVPDAGDSFVLFESVNGMVSGSPDSLSIFGLPGNLDWSIDRSDPRLVTLEFVPNQFLGDFDADGDYSCNDIDMLVAEIVAGTNSLDFDLTNDALVDNDDLDAWLAEAGSAELASGNAYQYGDANLDGTVDGLDFIEWNGSKFTSTAAFCSGDFNADGTVDGLDFIIWNDNKFTSADAISAVPEPGSAWLLMIMALAMSTRRR